jgi:hypothetical protein
MKSAAAIAFRLPSDPIGFEMGSTIVLFAFIEGPSESSLGTYCARGENG